ncbi:MAG: hypothetical protein NVS1B11_10500 [Terriglobales bacterium]
MLAQFRHDAILTWVTELRSFLDLKELKWRDYRNRREYVLSNHELSQRVRAGLEQAELTIIDLPMYRRITLIDLIDQGAEAGHDYDLTILNDLTSRRMISESPLGRLSHLEDYSETLPFTYFNQSRGLSKPAELQARAGGKLNDAVVLAARAHSILVLVRLWRLF